MSERSKAWQEKKSQLDLREKRIKSELEDASTNVEERVKTVLKISLITGGVFLAGYGLYKMLSSSEEEVERSGSQKQDTDKQKAPEANVKSGFNLKYILLERLAFVAVKFIGSLLASFLNSKLDENEDETES